MGLKLLLMLLPSSPIGGLAFESPMIPCAVSLTTSVMLLLPSPDRSAPTRTLEWRPFHLLCLNAAV